MSTGDQVYWTNGCNDNTAGDFGLYEWQYVGGDHYIQQRPYAPLITVGNPFGNFMQKLETRGEVKQMRGLFNVHIVDPDKGKVVASCLLMVAKSGSNAKLKAISEIAATGVLDGDIDDYDIIDVRLGDVRAKKEVQEVKVINNAA